MSQFFHKAGNPLFEFLFEFFLFFRGLFFFGTRYKCPCCGWKIRAFTIGGAAIKTRELGYCPRCNSKSRHRRDWLYLQDHTNLFSAELNLFHVSPKYSFSRKLANRKNINYLGVDLSHRRNVQVFVDITACSFKSETFDAIICIHVLEEIPDDHRAMQELNRILKPGGWAFITVPIELGQKTYEDPKITSPEDRLVAFGESDHVRIYGLDITDRLEESGFEVSVDFGMDIPDHFLDQYGLKKDENIFFCRKPEDTTK